MSKNFDDTNGELAKFGGKYLSSLFREFDEIYVYNGDPPPKQKPFKASYFPVNITKF